MPALPDLNEIQSGFQVISYSHHLVTNEVVLNFHYSAGKIYYPDQNLICGISCCNIYRKVIPARIREYLHERTSVGVFGIQYGDVCMIPVITMVTITRTFYFNNAVRGADGRCRRSGVT